MTLQSMIIAATGVQLVCSASSATAQLPRAADGNPPRQIRVSATGNCYVRPLTSAVGVATSGDILVTAGQALTLTVRGMPYLAYLQDAGVNPAVKLNISPIEG
ncbi:MAG: hypothetical protein ORO03_03470 [Alphaproteobacteria bacterium]|nr:hypothetical protein [Alphaproteobacteria bacterium]